MDKDHEDKEGILRKGGGRFISSKTAGVGEDLESRGGRKRSTTKRDSSRDSKKSSKKSSKSKSSSSSSDKSGGYDDELSGGSSSSSGSHRSKSSSRSSIKDYEIERHEHSFEMDKFIDTNNYKADY